MAGTTTAGATTAAFSGGGALVGTGVTTTQSGAGMVRGRWLRSYSRLSATCSSSSSFLRSAYSCHHLAHRQYVSISLLQHYAGERTSRICKTESTSLPYGPQSQRRRQKRRRTALLKHTEGKCTTKHVCG